MNDMDQNEELAGLCAFCRRSNYDLIQCDTGGGWGAVWTYVSNDVHAAERAGQQMRRIGAIRIRHACRVVVSEHGHSSRDVVVITVFPDAIQHMVDLYTVKPMAKMSQLMDAPLQALAASAGLG